MVTSFDACQVGISTVRDAGGSWGVFFMTEYEAILLGHWSHSNGVDNVTSLNMCYAGGGSPGLA